MSKPPGRAVYGRARPTDNSNDGEERAAMQTEPRTETTGHSVAHTDLPSALEAAIDAAIVADPDGDILLLNSAAERLLGYQREEVLDRPVSFVLPGIDVPGGPTL